MNKLIKLSLLFLLIINISGCSKPKSLMSSKEYIEYQYINNKEEVTVCLDGVEYFLFPSAMAPHIQADTLDYPKVVRCGKEDYYGE